MIKHLVPLLAAALAAPSFALAAASLPVLQKNGAATQLHVDGKPFLMLAGELHNSSSSSDEYMAPIWPKLKAMHLNTVVSTVSWDMVEPREGQFDFSSLDSQLAAARQNGLRLVMIWFGSFKNARST
jgi:GH35 family endo-1,4-beta-xylanase